MTTDIETIGLAMDTSGIEKGIRSLDELAARGPKVEKSMQGVATAATQAGQGVASLGGANASGLDKVAGSGERAAQGLGKMGQAAQSAVSSQDALKRAVESFNQAEEKYLQGLVSEYKALSQSRGEKAAYIAAQQGMSQGAQEVAKALGDKIDAYKREQVELANLSKASSGTTESLLSIARTGAKAIVASALLATIKGVSQAMFDASAQAERFRTTLNFATGGKGAQEIDYLRRVTNELGLQFASTAQAYSGFQAAARGTALEGQKAKDVFESIAKASAVMGLSADQSSGVLLALQQMISKGTVQAEELRGQLGERLPGAFQIAAKAMGVTTAELGKMLEQGQVIADDFLPRFAKSMNESLGDAAEKATDRLDAATNRFASAWDRLKQAGGDRGVSRAMANEMNAITRDMIAITEAMENAGRTGGSMWTQIGSGAGVAAGRLAFSTLNLVANTLNGTINALTGGILGLNTKMAIMPDAFKMNAEQVAIMGGEMEKAQAKLKRLHELDAMPSNGNYFKTAIADTNAYIVKLQEAIRVRAGLSGDADPRDIPTNMTRGASFARFAQEQKDSEQKMLDIRMRQSGVNKQYLQDLKDLQQALARNVIGTDEYTKRVSDLATKTWEGSVAGKEAEKGLKSVSSEAKKAATEYKNLISAVNEKISAQQQELSQSGRLTDSQKLTIKLTEEMASGKLHISSAQKAEIEGRIQLLAGLEKEVKQRQLAVQAYAEQLAIQDELNADYVAQSKAREVGRMAVDAYARGINESNDMLKYELSLMGLSERQRNVLLEQRRIELDLENKIEEVKKNSGFDTPQREEEIARLRAAAAIAQANVTSKVFLEDWNRSVSQYDDIFRKGFADMLNNGKDGWKSFTRSLVTTFKTSVADQIYKMFAQPFVVQIVGSLMGITGGGAGGAAMQVASGGSNLMGMANNAYSAYSGFNTGLLSNFGAAAPGSLYSSGAQLYAQGFETIGNGMMGLGNSMAQYADAINTTGSALGYAGSIYSLTQGHYGAAAGSAIGTYFAGPIGAALGGWLGGFVDKWTGSRGANHSGGVYSTKDTDRNAAAAGLGLTGDALGDFTARGNQALDAQLGTTVGALSNVYQGLAKYAGDSAKQIDIVAGFAVNGKYRDEDAYGYFKLLDKKTGQVLADYVKRGGGLGNDPEKAFAQYSADMGKALVDEIRKADIPKWMDGMFATLDKDVTLDKLKVVLQQVSAAQAAFESFGQYMPTFAAMTMEAQDALVKAAGGVAPLQANMGTFVENFYSDSEKLAIKTENMRQALESLGFEMPKTREEFRDLVQSQLALGEAGAKGAAGLLGLNAAFAEITPATQSAAASVSTLAEQLATAFGTTAESLSGILQDAVKNSETAAEARAAASKAFEEQFYGGALTSLTDSLGSMLQSSVIGPLMESLVAGAAASSATLASGGAMAASAMAAGGVAGASASAAGGSAAAGAMASGGSAAAGAMVSGGSAVGAMVQSAIDQARVQINAYTQILTDPQVQAGIKDISKLMGEVAGLTFTAQQSWESSGGGYSSPGSYSSAADSADKLGDALKKLGDTMSDEVKRLRGLMVDDSPQARDVLMAQFTMNTAMARAGDQAAASKLPELSKAIESATAASAISAVEVARMRGWLAGSLEDTLRALKLDLPQFAIGTNYVPRTMAAIVHEGEAIVPKAFNPWAGGAPVSGGGSDNQALLAEVRSLREENAQQAAQIATLTLRMARVLEGWEATGMPEARTDNWSHA